MNYIITRIDVRIAGADLHEALQFFRDAMAKKTSASSGGGLAL